MNATIDASKTGPPISKHIYGQFLEHGGNIVNEGMWAEMRRAASSTIRSRRRGLRRLAAAEADFPAGGDQPAVNPGSPTYPLDVVAALSEDRKTLTFAVLNPSASEQKIKLAIQGVKLGHAGQLWQMAPKSIDASNTLGKDPEVSVQEQAVPWAPDSLPVPPFSVNIYSFPVR